MCLFYFFPIKQNGVTSSIKPQQITYIVPGIEKFDHSQIAQFMQKAQDHLVSFLVKHCKLFSILLFWRWEIKCVNPCRIQHFLSLPGLNFLRIINQQQWKSSQRYFLSQFMTQSVVCLISFSHITDALWYIGPS